MCSVIAMRMFEGFCGFGFFIFCVSVRRDLLVGEEDIKWVETGVKCSFYVCFEKFYSEHHVGIVV